MHPIDTNLIERCEQRDRKAQSELYRVLFSTLMSVATRYEKERSDAKAMVNLGFLKILTNLSTRKVGVPFEAWSRRIMINTVIDEYRKNEKRKMVERTTDQLEATQHAPVNLNDVEHSIATEELENMLHRLPKNSGKVFNLFAIDGYGHKEISKMLGISVGTSKWHVSHARQQLKQMLSQHTNAVAKT